MKVIFAAVCVVGLSSPALAYPVAPDDHLPRIVGFPKSYDTYLRAPNGARLEAPRESEDVPYRSWPYQALDKLRDAELVEGRPPRNGIEPMTRREFAIALLRFFERINAPRGIGLTQEADSALKKLIQQQAQNTSPYMTVQALTDLTIALYREFAADVWLLKHEYENSDELDLVFGPRR